MLIFLISSSSKHVSRFSQKYEAAQLFFNINNNKKCFSILEGFLKDPVTENSQP